MSYETNHLFIYGTLKRGDVRAPLLNGQHFIGDVRTEPSYRLFDTGEYPALVEAEPLGLVARSIRGELWKVDAACLVRLDLEEGLDEGLYARQSIKLLGRRQIAMGYLYLLPIDGMADCGDSWDMTC
ncbi:MAG: gamma-glutamylcyclotransferase [Phycisphaeraceae bacterium]